MNQYKNCSFGNLKKFICIEGNIGSGKSTFIKMLYDNFGYSIVPEPTSEWQNINGSNLLNEFYKDTNRWAYTFQSLVFLTRIRAIEDHLNKPESNNFFVERSVFADKYTFAKACHETGHINKLEWDVYNLWYNWMLSSHCPIPSGFIYLRVSPEVSYERIKKRGRNEECNISIEYLKRLHDCHEEWLCKNLNNINNIDIFPILILDCDNDFQYNKENWNLIIEKVNDFIQKCFNNYNIFTLKESKDERINQ